MQLNLQTNLETELQTILKQAIESGAIDSTKLRMVILTPDLLFEKLSVCVRYNWDTYFLQEDVTVLGEINISQWMDVADDALEMQREIPASYIELAKSYQPKYALTAPAFGFDHLTILEEAYQAYLVCLREELFFQIEVSIRAVATSFSQDDFAHVVGFATHRIPFDLASNVVVQAFAHPQGAGPFYKAQLTLPEHKRSRPYLHFSETSFQLFYPNGTIHKQSETEVHSFELSEIKLAWLEDDEIQFRLEDEFKNWELSGGSIDRQKGDFSEKELFAAFEAFLNQSPGTFFNIHHIPNPATDSVGFKNWVSKVSEYNLKVSKEIHEELFIYNEAIFWSFIEQFEPTQQQYRQAIRFLSFKLFYQGRFQESFHTLNLLKKHEVYEKEQLIGILFLLKNKDAYEAYRPNLESNNETVAFLDGLWDLRTMHLEKETLKGLEATFLPLLDEYKNKTPLRLLSVLLVKLYALLDKPEKAIQHLQQVPAYESFEQMVLKQELAEVEYVVKAYEARVQKEISKAEFQKQLAKNSLIVLENSKPVQEKTSCEHCFYLKGSISTDFEWACPLGEDVFLAVQSGNELILGKLIKNNTIEIEQTVALPKTRKNSSGVFADGILYMADTELGIVTYAINQRTIKGQGISHVLYTIKELDTVYQNKKTKARYENLALADGYLYASNNGFLEIYELNKPDAVLSDSLFIESGYYLFVRDHLLVVGAGAGLVILADISDKTNPVFLSSITENSTPSNMHVEFVGDYLISQSVFDISDPAAPKWISYVGDELAPTYFFAPKPETPIFSTGNEFLLTTLKLEDNKPFYTNWYESLNAQNHFYECVTYNYATAYFGDSLVTYSKYDIRFWEKGLRAVKQSIEVQDELEVLVRETFIYLKEQHPDFKIGKVVLKHELMYSTIEIAFHACSTLASLASTSNNHQQPIVASYFNFREYSHDVLGLEPENLQFVYNGAAFVNQLIESSAFEQMAARHVLVWTDTESMYLHFVNKEWHPFRSAKTISQENPRESFDANRSMDLHEILDWLNRKPEDNRDNVLSNRLPWKEFREEENEDITDDEEDILPKTVLSECYFTKCYLHGPVHVPEIKEEEDFDKDQKIEISYSQKIEMRAIAFGKLCALPDRNLVRLVIFNGMKFGYMHFDLKDLPANLDLNLSLIHDFVNNLHGLWDEFGQDPEIRLFLMSNLASLHYLELQAKFVYLCGNFSHPTLLEYLRYHLENGLYFDTYKGFVNGINISSLPAEALKPLEKVLLAKFNEFETSTDAYQQIEADQQIMCIYDLLCTLGQEKNSPMVEKKMAKAVKDYEKYGRPDDVFDEDYDETVDETAFDISIYRSQKVKRLLGYFAENEGALWPLTEAPELFETSWHNTIKKLFETGEKQFGANFKTQFITRLSGNIVGDAIFENDRLLAYQIVQFTFHYIQKQPELASLTEPLIVAIQQHKVQFSQKLDIAALKEKSKYTLLQAAWNDLKNKDWDLAEQKADAILVMDATMGQVHFLKARLLWLREGIPAYLAQQESFVEKCSHDIAAVARLYNLSGCALDVEKRYEESLAYFKKAALHMPQEPMYVANVAEMYYKMCKPKEALKHAKAAQANGNVADILKEIIQNKGIIVSS